MSSLWHRVHLSRKYLKIYAHAKLFNRCSSHYSGEQHKVCVNRRHKAFPNQVSFELFCCANTQRTEGNRERPTKVMVEHKLLLKRFFKSLGSSLFSQMLLPPHNYVASSNNHFVIWANSTFYLKREAKLKTVSPVLKWASNGSSCVDTKAVLLLNTGARQTSWFHNVMEFVHSIFTLM